MGLALPRGASGTFQKPRDDEPGLSAGRKHGWEGPSFQKKEQNADRPTFPVHTQFRCVHARDVNDMRVGEEKTKL